MEWGQQMRNHQTNMLDSTYQNSNYSFERENRKTLIVDLNIGSATTKFNASLQEPFIIDKLSDVYLESFTTFNASANTATNKMGFSLNIDQFNINNNTNNPHLFNKIFIPNEKTSSSANISTIHKSKKLNYICQINPCKLDYITGSILSCPLSGSDADTNFMDADGRFIIEFVIVARD